MYSHKEVVLKNKLSCIAVILLVAISLGSCQFISGVFLTTADKEEYLASYKDFHTEIQDIVDALDALTKTDEFSKVVQLQKRVTNKAIADIIIEESKLSGLKWTQVPLQDEFRSITVRLQALLKDYNEDQDSAKLSAAPRIVKEWNAYMDNFREREPSVIAL